MNRESPTAEPKQDGLPVPRRYWSAAGIWLALTMAVLDSSIANVALPTIAGELGASAATSVWVINAYQLTITILLLPISSRASPAVPRFRMISSYTVGGTER